MLGLQALAAWPVADTKSSKAGICDVLQSIHCHQVSVNSMHQWSSSVCHPSTCCSSDYLMHDTQLAQLKPLPSNTV